MQRDAKTQLQWVIDHAEEAGLKDAARLRLAAILLDEKNHDGALKLLEAVHPESFDGLYADLRGDVLSAQGKTDEARSAYKLAYEKTDDKSAYRNVIQMKLDALGAGQMKLACRFLRHFRGEGIAGQRHFEITRGVPFDIAQGRHCWWLYSR